MVRFSDYRCSLSTLPRTHPSTGGTNITPGHEKRRRPTLGSVQGQGRYAGVLEGVRLRRDGHGQTDVAVEGWKVGVVDGRRSSVETPPVAVVRRPSRRVTDLISIR